MAIPIFATGRDECGGFGVSNVLHNPIIGPQGYVPYGL